MLRDADVAAALLGGAGAPLGHATGTGTDAGGQLFAAYEASVHRRTNAAHDALGRRQLPWPRALGTPPWGLAAELSRLTGRRYRTEWLRRRPRAVVEQSLGLLPARLAADQPAAIYVGSPTLPRHVGLVVPEGEGLAAYDPARGTVSPWPSSVGDAGRLGLGDWPVLWCRVSPR